MKKEILSTLNQLFEANILKHKTNVEIMLTNPMAIHDHTNLIEGIEKEISCMAEYMDKLEVMKQYFNE